MQGGGLFPGAGGLVGALEAGGSVLGAGRAEAVENSAAGPVRPRLPGPSASHLLRCTLCPGAGNWGHEDLGRESPRVRSQGSPRPCSCSRSASL